MSKQKDIEDVPKVSESLANRSDAMAFRYLLVLVIAVCVGLAATALFYVLFFLVMGMVDGASGSAPWIAGLYAGMMSLAERTLGIAQAGSLGQVSLFWGGVAALATFAGLSYRLNARKRSKVESP